MNRTGIVWAAIGGTAFVAMVLSISGIAGADVFVTLVFGWLKFIGTVLPDVQVRWDGVAMAGVAFVLFVAVAHYLASWLYREFHRNNSDESAPRSWRLRWTLSFSVVLILLFVAGISLVGVTHQAVWLANDSEPMRERVLEPHGRMSQGNDLKQIGLGFHNCVDATSGGLPGDLRDKEGQPLHSWAARMLPYSSYYVDLELSKPWDAPSNMVTFKKPVPIFLNPKLRTTQLQDSEGFWFNHYAANVRVLGDGDCPLDVLPGGTSSTILMGEVNDNFLPWGKPGNFRDPALGLNNSPDGFGGPKRSRGVMFLMADGSVRFIANQIEPDALKCLSGPDRPATETDVSAQ